MKIETGHRIVQLLALSTIALSLIVGIAWQLDLQQFLAFGTDNLAMAPSTALLFLLLGASLFASSRWPYAPAASLFTLLYLSILALYSLLLGWQALIGDDVLQYWKTEDASRFSLIMTEPMAPFTLLAFLIASIALYCQRLVWGKRFACPFTSVGLAWSVFLISQMTLNGYASGFPPTLWDAKSNLEGLTAFAFMLTSAAILLPPMMQFGQRQLPTGEETGKTTRWAIAVATIGIVIAAVLRVAIVDSPEGNILPYVTFYPTVLIVALSMGLAGGLLATLLAGTYVQVWLYGGALETNEWLALTIFLSGSTMTSFICEAMRQSQAKEREANHQLRLALAEHERATKALQISEEKFRSAFEQAAVGVARLATDGSWLEVNEKLCEIVGYGREELLSGSFQDIVHPDDLRAASEDIDRLLNDEINNYSMEMRCFNKNGVIVWINLSISLAHELHEEPRCFISIVEDITERKELHDRLEKIATHVPGVIYQYQQWPDGHAAFPYASTSIRDIYGVEPEEVLTDASPVFSRFHPDDLPRIKDKIADSMRDLTVWEDSYRVKFPDGRVIWVEGEASPEPQLDGSILWHGSVREITDRIQVEKERRQLQKMLGRTEQIAKIGSWEWDVVQDKATWSDELFRIFQIDPAEGAPAFAQHHRLYDPEDFIRLQTAVDNAINQGTTYALELRARRRDGKTLMCLASGYPERDSDHQVTRLYGFLQDITERKQDEHDLRLAASVFEHSFEAIMITDAHNRIIDTNPAFSAITGYEQAAVLGKNPNILSSGRHDQAFYREMWESIAQNGVWRGEIWNRRKDGQTYAELLSISTVYNADGSVQNFIAVFTDINEIKTHEAELDRIANYDHLTGLPNRRLLSDRLEQAIAGLQRSGKRIAVCYLDLDDFKPINDRFGHEVGDALLVGIAHQLRNVLRAQDTVARIGGDEFVLLLNDLKRLEDSQFLLERVLAAANSPIVVQGVTHRVSASIGVTLSPPDSGSADILLRHADQAMYRAKDAGRNRYHLYDTTQDRQIQNRRLKLQQLEEALTNQEFVLHYQPKVDMVSREVIGVEALIRWQHPQQGLLLPGAFLPMIEGSHLEIAAGEWVISTALTQVASWQRIGLDLPISVNISAGHLLAPSFARRLKQLLIQHPECDPGCLEMEVLETSALSDIVQASQTLTACRELGVRFALDDFGTGYASLAYFRKLPIDVLKIDQSFVRDMLDDPNDMEIVESVVRLAHAFQRTVVAEGVETPEHGALLTPLGCRLGQGFGIARPMPANAIPDWTSIWPEQGNSMVVDRGRRPGHSSG